MSFVSVSQNVSFVQHPGGSTKKDGSTPARKPKASGRSEHYEIKLGKTIQHDGSIGGFLELTIT